MELGESFHAVEILILLLLVLVAIFAVMANRLKVPYPIVLVIAGLVISFFPRMPRIPLDPDIVFVIFLPPLLYASAWSASLREFKRNAVVIGLLAVGLVAFTVWGVAEFSDHFITALDWKAGFLLGAVVATTDAIAATSIAKSIGLPRRIVDILEGESLLNDATGLLALEMGLGIILRGESPTVGSGALRLLTLVVGGDVIGLLIAVGATAGERSMGGTDLHSQRSGLCAHRPAVAVCARWHTWKVWDEHADLLWHRVHLRAHLAANDVGFSGSQDRGVC